MPNVGLETLPGIIDRELAWQASLQLGSGALPMYGPEKPGGIRRVNPYFAAISARSLLLRPAQYAVCVRRYMDWHLAHLNNAAEDINGLDGTIYDYSIAAQGQDGRLVETAAETRFGKKTYDSTDSYAALFLSLMSAYHSKTRDDGYLCAQRQSVTRICRAMCATLEDGLTYARPDFRVKYLMDNCEVLRGLEAAEGLFRALDALTGEGVFRALSLECRRNYRAVFEAIEGLLFDHRNNAYAVGVDSKGRRMPRRLNPNLYYPDAMAQLFPILTRALPVQSERARRIYKGFNQHFSTGKRRWEAMQGDATAVSSIHGITARVAAMMGDTDRVLSYMAWYVENVQEKGHAGCLNAEGAHVAMAADILLRGR